MKAPRQEKGAVIKATTLNAYANRLDALDPGIKAPKDRKEPAVPNEQADAGTVVYNFLSRQTVDEVVDTVTVEKDTQVIFSGSDGQTHIFNITYP